MQQPLLTIEVRWFYWEGFEAKDSSAYPNWLNRVMASWKDTKTGPINRLTTQSNRSIIPLSRKGNS